MLVETETEIKQELINMIESMDEVFLTYIYFLIKGIMDED